jgi:hypothetical protein
MIFLKGVKLDAVQRNSPLGFENDKSHQMEEM